MPRSKLEWVSRKRLILFSIYLAMISLGAIMSHATCKPPDQAGYGPKPAVIKQNKYKMYITAALQEVYLI